MVVVVQQEERNLQVFLIPRKTDRKHSADELGEAQEEMIDHW